MPVPSPRNKILPARGNHADLASNVASLLDGEICYAIDQDQYYQNEGGVLVSVGATKAQGALADSATQPGDNVSTLTNDAGYITSAQAPVQSVAGKTGVVTLAKADITDFSDADYATAAQGALADSATQPGDNVSTLTNNAGYITSAQAPVQSVAGKTGAVTLVKGDVGLGNVDNTSDLSKPISTATQTALNLKANLASPALTGTPTAPTATAGTNTTQLATTAFVSTAVANKTTNFNDLTNKTSGTGNYTTTGNFSSAAIIPTGATVPTNGMYLPSANQVGFATNSAFKFGVDSLDGNPLFENNYPTIRPTLDLRFAATKKLDPRITFTRASTGTYTDQFGVLQTAATDQARFDHNPTTGESLGLLVEESRTNLLLRSEEFDNASWVKTNATITANSVASPTGAATADTLIENAGTGAKIVSQSFSFTTGLNYCVSVYVKAAGRTEARISLGSAAFSTGPALSVNLSTGAVTSSGDVSASAVSVGDGWWRLVLVGLSTATALASVAVSPLLSGVANYTGDGTSGIYVWGAQLEAGAFPTSYIPTTSATVTRAADVASITGTNFSSWYRQDEGTVFTDAIPSSTGGNGITGFDDGTSANRWRVGHTGTSASALVVVDGSVVQVNSQTTAGSWPVNTSGKIAAAVQLNNFAVSNNGQASVEDLAGTMPTVTQMTIGTAQAASYANARIRRLTYWPQRLSNATLQTLTQ